MEKETTLNVEEIATLAGYSPEVVQSYLELGITASEEPEKIAEEIQECYSGEFSSDEAFAQEQAESMGELPQAGQSHWPLYCIDWEYAARELMYDYSEQGGHYFRNV